MQVVKFLKRFTAKLEPFHTLLEMLAFFVGALIAIYAFFIRPQDVSVVIQKQEVNFPNSVDQKYLNVFKYLSDSCKKTEILDDAMNVYNYLESTNSFWIIKLQNETKNSIKNITLKVTNVNALNAWSFNGSFLLAEEKAKLLKATQFEESSGIIHIDRIENLPAKAEIRIYLWGKIPNLALDESVLVQYDGGDASPGKETTVSGFKAYLTEYLYELIIMMFLVFIAVYIRQMKRRPNANS